MFTCPNCGGNLKYDIPSGQLACEYCQTQADPYSFENKTSDAVAGKNPENYEVTIFTCPQCGGEILSTDNAAAGFCSFCGASTVLFSRISNEHRPNFIIPFQKTKEDCKQAYSDMMKKAIFAPSALKDPQKIDSFRGIYMPYWAFYITEKGPFSVSGSKSHRRGDYIITDHYNLTGDMDAYFKGISYDASSSFADSISEAIAPFDVRGMKKFTPAFLSGFYADTADVDAAIYEPEAKVLANEEILKQVQKENAFAGISMQNPQTSLSQLPLETKAIDQAMFPVWFMSYRNGDRVSYMTVNGQTGKVVSDLPVDPKKYILGSLLLALPIFLILNLFFTIIPNTLLTIVAILATIATLISTIEIYEIAKKEAYSGDLGMLFKTDPSKLNETLTKKHSHVPLKQRKMPSQTMIYILIIVSLQVLISGGFAMAAFMGTLFSSGILWIAILMADIIICIVGFRKIHLVPNRKGLFAMILSLVSVLLGAIVVLLQPAQDAFYYGAAVLMLISVIISEMGIIEQYNLLSTRRLPQFDKQGGDDRA